MRRLIQAVLIGTMALGVLSTVPSSAEDMSAGKAPAAGEAARGVQGVAFKGSKAKAMPGIKADRSASRTLELDEKAMEKAFTLVGRSRDGTVTKMAPGDAVIKAIKGEAKGAAAEKRTMLDTVEPDEAGDETARAVVGDDNRLNIRNSKTFPYSSIGYLESTNAKGEIYSCAAAVIGRNTVLTAGHCLYDHNEDGGWLDKFVFWPAINGENDVPFGGYEYDMAYVFEGFISDYDGSYDTVWPYDIAMLTFTDPIGDSVGWMGYAYDPDLGDFQGNLVGYHDDKTPFTMWRSTCNVLTENIVETDFTHDCDFAAGATGAPIYVYDKADQTRTIVGVNVGESGATNWALRLYPAVFEWIQTVNK